MEGKYNLTTSRQQWKHHTPQQLPCLAFRQGIESVDTDLVRPKIKWRKINKLLSEIGQVSSNSGLLCYGG